MTERGPTAVSLTRRAIEAASEGKTADARKLLADALSIDDEYEPAWLWFASLAGSGGESRFCLEQALGANPDGASRAALESLGDEDAVVPPELEDLVDPPPPAALTATEARPPHRPRRLWLGAGAVALALAIGTAVGVLGWTGRERPVYVAFVAGLSGPDARNSDEMAKSVQLYLDRVNDDGGVDGHPVELLVYDDEDDATLAKERAREIVADGRVLAVIGNRTSEAAEAAGPIYAAARIPAITPTATADSITERNPWYFRTIFSNRAQGSAIATYIRHVLGARTASIVYGNATYGRTLAAGFRSAFGRVGNVEQALEIDVSGGSREATIRAAAAALRGSRLSEPVVVAVQSRDAPSVAMGLRRGGVTAYLVGGDTLGTEAFFESLAELGEQNGQPLGSLSKNIYAAAPLHTDSLGGDAVRWLFAFRDRYGFIPTWRSATAYEAAIVAVHALSQDGLSFESDARAADRRRIRDALAALDSPGRSVLGLTGPLYFDDGRSAVKPVFFGTGRNREFTYAPEQLHPYSPAAGVDPVEEVAAGRAVRFAGALLERQRIVATGINLNELGELDVTNETFFADFFLWLRYAGGDDVVDVEFVNAVDPALPLGDPVRKVTVDNNTYVLYRIARAFKAELDFHDFPFDRQNLSIVIQNRRLSSSQVIYAGDPEVLAQSQDVRLTSGTNTGASINTIPNWHATQVLFHQATVGSTAHLGDPTLAAGLGGVHYAQFVTDVTVRRDVHSFLFKNLLPLALLALVTYTALFFPYSQVGARVTFAITGILTGAVLLTDVTNQLPPIGYNTAIEWGYYAFILLSATCLLIGLAGDHFYEQRRSTALRRLTIAARIYYPAFVIAVVLAYVWAY